jgi:streptogramin lyase
MAEVRRLLMARIRPAAHRRRSGGALRLETLEPRQLLTATVTEYPALSGGSTGSILKPSGIVVGPDEKLWFTEPTANTIGAFNTTTHLVSTQVASTNATAGDPTSITATSGTGAAIWYNLAAVGELGEFVPGGGAQSAQVLTEGGNYYASSSVTAIGGNIWAALPAANELLEYGPTTDAISNFSLAPANINISGFSAQIALGPDGNLWFTEPGAIGVFSLTSDTVIAQISLPTTSGTQMPTAIAIGADGNMWFTASTSTSSAVGVINAATYQYITEFALPAAADPMGITAGPDENMWFTESGTGAIGMINVVSRTNPAADTLGTAIAISKSVVAGPDPQGITAGLDGNLWFADAAGAIGVVTLNASPHFAVTTALPTSVTAGADFGLTVTAEYSPTVPDVNFDGSVTATLYNKANLPVGTPTTVTAVDGVASFANLTWDTAGAGFTIVVKSSASSPPTSVTTGAFSVVPAAPVAMVVTAEPPTTVTAGGAFGVTVALKDQFGNVATNFSGGVVAALANDPGGSALGGTTTAIVSPTGATPGYATFTNLTLNKASGGYVLRLSEGGATATTDVINVVPGAASTLVVTSPPPGTVNPGQAFGMTVVLRDSYGNVATGYSGTVSVSLANNPGGGTLSGPVSETLVAPNTGVVTFAGLALNNPGAGYVLRVSASGLSDTTTVGVNVPAPIVPAVAPTITGESVVYVRKLKKGRPVGKLILAGYTITFSTAMNPGTLSDLSNFLVETVVTKKATRKKPATTRFSAVGFSVTSVTAESVTVRPVGTPFAKKAGMITLGTPGVESAAGVYLASPAVLNIARGGKVITRQ